MLSLLLALVAAPDTVLVGPEWLAPRLGTPGLVVLHTGTRATYDSAHVAGARHLSPGRFEVIRNGLATELPPLDEVVAALEEAGVSDGDRIVVYGDPIPAARLFFTLDVLGLGGQASVLDGGLQAWSRAGGAVGSGAGPSMPRGRLAARARPDLVVSAEWVRARLGTGAMTLVDARSPEEYRGDREERGVAAERLGHIPGAAAMDWNTILSEGRLLAEPALRARFEEAGAGGDRPVVAYCRTGARAAVVYLAARHLGYDTLMYDGSMVEWFMLDGFPVTRGSDRWR